MFTRTARHSFSLIVLFVLSSLFTLAPAPYTSQTATPPCDQGAFISDVSIPTNAAVRLGEKFTKTWHIRNTGSCTWQIGYTLVFNRGAAMGAPDRVLINRTVPPGAGIEVSVPMVAPRQTGEFVAVWRLLNSRGIEVRSGSAPLELFVQLRVIEPPTPVPTLLGTPRPTPVYTPTATPKPCNLIQSVVDLNVPDNTMVVPNQPFLKSWQVTNGGSCTWTTKYKIVYASGEGFRAKKEVPMPYDVKPGQTVDITLKLFAPWDEGTFQGFWKLESPNGQVFGVGRFGTGAFWAKIRVNPLMKEPFPLYDLMCKAKWTTSKGDLKKCPAPDSNFIDGSISFDENPRIEGGKYRYDQPTLITVPSSGDDGFIQGVFPAFIPMGTERFTTVIGCLHGADRCSARVKLGYLDREGAYHDLISPEIQFHDHNYHDIEFSLKEVRGKTIQFVIRVESLGNSKDDSVFWLYPTLWVDRGSE